MNLHLKTSSFQMKAGWMNAIWTVRLQNNIMCLLPVKVAVFPVKAHLHWTKPNKAPQHLLQTELKKKNKSCVGNLNNVLQMWANILPVNKKNHFIVRKKFVFTPLHPHPTPPPTGLSGFLRGFRHLSQKCESGVEEKKVFSPLCYFFFFSQPLHF